MRLDSPCCASAPLCRPLLYLPPPTLVTSPQIFSLRGIINDTRETFEIIILEFLFTIWYYNSIQRSHGRLSLSLSPHRNIFIPPLPCPPPSTPLSLLSIHLCTNTRTQHPRSLSLSLYLLGGVCAHTINEAYIFTSSSYSSPSSHPSDSGTLHTHPPYSGHFRALYA